MKTSVAGRDLIKRFEGLRLREYLDSAGLATIGYGHLMSEVDRVTYRDGITYVEADAILTADLASAEGAVTSLVTAPLTQNQFDALVSFTFNLGRTALARSTLLRRLNAGNYAIENEFKKWDKAKSPKTGTLVRVPGLTRRREAEAALWSRK